MNALRCSLKQLLTAHRDRKFVVPNYQREYEWETASEGKGEVGQFWDDIWHNSWKTGRKHFLGVILVNERGADSELVDGQQRVTTVFLLLLALRDLLLCSATGIRRRVAVYTRNYDSSLLRPKKRAN